VLLPRVSTVAALTGDLSRRVLDGEFAPGTQLREAELTREYAVARHSVRAALQAMVHAGLIAHLPNRGAFVPQMSADDVVDLFRLRAAIEVEAVTELTESRYVSDEVLVALDGLGNLQPDARQSELIEADLRFHRALVDSLASERLSRVYADLQRQLELGLTQLRGHWGTSQTLRARHGNIVELIRSGTPSASAAEVRWHLSQSQKWLRQAYGSTISAPSHSEPTQL
jgi:DNA-binding GntR family transcriptional regulator